LIGRSAERALLDDLAAVLKPGQRVLDAGCGTGALSRQIRQLEPRVQLTMLDLSPGMLARTCDVPGDRLIGDVQDLPFSDESFDVVASAWVIETVPDPVRAAREFARVIQGSGYVFYTFASFPSGFLSEAASAFLRSVVERRFAGEFLRPERTPWHDCARSHRYRFHGGLTTEIALRKCCDVGPALGARQRQTRPPGASRHSAMPTEWVICIADVAAATRDMQAFTS
jgi:ubiquinone/menaquinone biosynthesis C-methylase UbiE